MEKKACSSIFISFFFFSFTHIYFPASIRRQAAVTGVVTLLSIIIAYRIQESHCWLRFYRVLQTHALSLPPSQIVHKKKVPTKSQEEYGLRGIGTHETGLPGSWIT